MELISNTNCQGEWEGNLLKQSDETCKQICQQIPTCRAAVVNTDGYCYVKGNHDRNNTKMACDKHATDKSYVKRWFKIFGAWLVGPMWCTTLGAPAYSRVVFSKGRVKSLPLPNEDFGSRNKRWNPDFEGSTFQGREYSIWATNRWKLNRKSALHLLFILLKVLRNPTLQRCWSDLPKSSFVEHKPNDSRHASQPSSMML